ncbi:MAG: AAA family ATPase [Halobacteriales archaeon]
MTRTNPESPSASLPDTIEPMTVSEATDVSRSIIENVSRVIVGKDEEIKDVLIGALAGGHLLLEDVPGVGKTMLARSIARSIDCEFSRIQFTPDLLPTDVTGVNVYNQQTATFEFQPGPVFGNVVLGDEINRAPPKTQSALLEAMGERQVTVDGETRGMPEPFVVIATQNAVETDRTYELPAAQVDRFMKQLRIGYPESEDESEVLRRAAGHHPIEELTPVATARDLLRARETVVGVTVEEPIREYVIDLATYTRENAVLGVSPRGAIQLVRAAKARAVLDGREYVVPDDIKAEVLSVFGHRIRRGSDDRIGGEASREVAKWALDRVPVQ